MMNIQINRSLLAALCSTMMLLVTSPTWSHGGDEKANVIFEQAIPNIPGKSLIAVEVEYAPEAASIPHVHAESAFIYAYVVSGAIESKVNDEDIRIYRAGQSWSESPGSTHPISRNASKTEPAKLLAIFVVNSDDKALTTPNH